jgi:uncharacterized glyoxalase superfamily protein PhnB
MQFDRTIPILRIFSVEKAKEFYVEFLGFELDWSHRYGEGFPAYMQVSRSGCTLHLSEHHGDATPGSALHIEMRGLDALKAELLGHDRPPVRPGIEDAPWGARVMTVIDPFGNRLLFNERRREAEASDRGAFARDRADPAQG